MLNEQQIEVRVKKATDHVEKSWMDGALDESIYRSELRRIDKWAEEAFEKIRLFKQKGGELNHQ